MEALAALPGGLGPAAPVVGPPGATVAVAGIAASGAAAISVPATGDAAATFAASSGLDVAGLDLNHRLHPFGGVDVMCVPASMLEPERSGGTRSRPPTGDV